jgi:hypothetical protein
LPSGDRALRLTAPPILLVAFVAGLVLAAAGKSADSGGTAPDPVTGGRRWWQKRWDE